MILAQIGLLFILSGLVDAQDHAVIKAEVIAADRARAEAALSGNGEEWAKYIADECVWVNLLRGQVAQNKAARVESLTQGGPGSEWKLSDEELHVLEGGEVVVQTGHYLRPSATEARFARTWRNVDGRWLMTANYSHLQ